MFTSFVSCGVRWMRCAIVPLCASLTLRIVGTPRTPPSQPPLPRAQLSRASTNRGTQATSPWPQRWYSSHQAQLPPLRALLLPPFSSSTASSRTRPWRRAWRARCPRPSRGTACPPRGRCPRRRSSSPRCPPGAACGRTPRLRRREGRARWRGSPSVAGPAGPPRWRATAMPSAMRHPSHPPCRSSRSPLGSSPYTGSPQSKLWRGSVRMDRPR
mmetsp:Transcript_34666/g.67085  ORF Transcript_34666/g.67085 Transcript_34666/m.67085 type:complete len:214 (-) Transcript_34666:87-728(-)